MFAEYNLFGRFVRSSCVSIGVLLLSANAVFAQYKVGDRVSVYGEPGTVIKMGPPIFKGGNEIYVHLDKFGDANPEASTLVDPVNSPGVKPAAAAAPQAPGGAPQLGGANVGRGGGNIGRGGGNGAGQAGGGNGAGQAGGGNNQPAGTDTIVSDNAPPTEETFKNVLRKNIPQPGWGDTLTLQFQQFNLSGPMAHVVRYAGNLRQETILGGPGRTVQAWKANTKFVQLTHYVDKYADDQAVTKSGDYWFYKDQGGHWVAEGENIQLSPTQFIKKN